MSSSTTEKACVNNLLINAYEQLEKHVELMNTLAQENKWDRLIDEEENYAMSVGALADLEKDSYLNESEQKIKYSIIKRILIREKNVRDQLMARREELSQMITTTRNTQDINREYGTANVIPLHDLHSDAS